MWWLLWSLVIIIVSYVLIVAVKDLQAFLRCKFYENQGFKMKYSPIFGYLSMFDPCPKQDKTDQLGKWKRMLEVCKNGPGLVMNDWDQSSAFIWLTDFGLVKEFFTKEIACTQRLKRYRERIHLNLYWHNDETSIELRNSFSELFKPESLNVYVRLVRNCWKEHYSQALRAASSANSTKDINLTEVVNDFIFDACNKIFFGEEYPVPMMKGSGKELIKELSDHLECLSTEESNLSLSNYLLFKLPSKYDLTPAFSRLTKQAEEIKEAILDLYNQRDQIETHKLGINMIDIMVRKNRESGGKAFSPDQIVDCIGLIVFAGTDTTSKGITACLFELAQRPEIAEMIRKDCKEFDLLNEKATTDTLDKSAILDAFIKESLRINAPGPFLIDRQVCCDFTLGKYSFKKGDIISVPFAILHMANQETAEKRTFDIHRFLDNDRAKCQPYIPFSLGRRNCNGKLLGELMLKVILSSTLDMSDIATDFEKFPSIWTMQETYGLDPCVLKCTPRHQ
jgi:cytochrome P450